MATVGVTAMNLPKNVGKTDRNIRLAVATLLVVVGIFSGQPILSVIGLVVLATSFIGTCPVYIPLKLNTNKDADEDD
jgi:hypothetical protein